MGARTDKAHADSVVREEPLVLMGEQRAADPVMLTTISKCLWCAVANSKELCLSRSQKEEVVRLP